MRHDFMLTCHSVQTARQPPSQLACMGFTGAGDFVLQFVIIFAMCTDRKQPLNQPLMRMRMWISYVQFNTKNKVLHRPNNN